jgi:signal transduction histidine kinase
MTLNHLLEDEYGELTDEQREIINLLVENNRDVNRLVVTLVTLYRYRNGKVELQMKRHQVSTLLSSTDEALMEKARLRHIAVRHECPGDDADIECDATEMQKLLNHLLENGIKYAKSEVVLRCSRQTNYLQITVEDDGCGLPAEDIETLFERFHYVSQSGKYSATTGVGLCLCAEIAKAHGGTINCQSTPGQGAIFTVSLPVVTK